MHDTTAQMIARRAANLNLDALLEVFLENEDTKPLRRELQALYCFIVNSLGTTMECFTEEMLDAMNTLQRIFEAVDRMTEPGERHLRIEAVR